MAFLPTDLRNKLERVIIEARDAAEIGARAALEALAVNHYEPYPHMVPEQRKLRNHLRARARQLGDRKLPRADTSGKDHFIDHLVGECAYEHWHRMLFARFLAENNLLIDPDVNMAISLAEAEELANEVGVDVWEYASRCAQWMLPQIFRPDDPLLQITFATEHILKLERLLASLPAAVFTASDALGWVYQFWQSKKKDEVNRSELKIGADEISAVTQLFTEPYMVEFLIHNTLGAWWAGKKLDAKDTANAKTEDELRAKLALPGVTWDYLRFVRGEDGKSRPWRPAAGTFDGWPKIAKSIKGLDPCCGSGHFLVALLRHLVPIRMAEEGLSTREAVDAVLRDNIHGLEIDERCCQLAAFAVALAAWTYPDAGGYRPLPELHIACTGIGPQATEEQWLKLAEQSGMPTKTDEYERVKNGMLNLYRLFSQAPTLGSLIDPRQLKADIFSADYEVIQPYLAAVLKVEKTDDETHEQTIAAAGMVKAAEILASNYTLVITNVPYLSKSKFDNILLAYCESLYGDCKSNLAACFAQRCLKFVATKGTIALVSMQTWLFQVSYSQFRKRLLSTTKIHLVATLGMKAFRTQMWDFAACLLIISSGEPESKQLISTVAVEKGVNAEEVPKQLPVLSISGCSQESQALNPDFVWTLTVPSNEALLGDFAESIQGIKTGDDGRVRRCFWEIGYIDHEWRLFQSTVSKTVHFGGLENILYWGDNGKGLARKQGMRAWGRLGVAISQMSNLPCAIYLGNAFDSNMTALVVKQEKNVSAVVAYSSSSDFTPVVRAIDQALKPTNSSFEKIPFNLTHWQKVAAEKYPDGLPEPESNDPMQWLFHGRPDDAEEGTEFQVAVVRLLGYRWPAEIDGKMHLSERARALVKRCLELTKFADNDGIVCIPAVRGEDPAAERLIRLLAACGMKPDVDLDNWLRNGFFEEHCMLFHDRPFVWHVWDGRKSDGFHALVNYHKLAEGGGRGRRLLENLTYAYLGEWITRQKDEVKRGEGGAEDRLAAALALQKRLEAILAGEPPFDIFVRWKPLYAQPIGWEPHINDGVRLNIRPFLASDLPGGKKGAGILRDKPNIKWAKDRGKEPQYPKEEYPWFWGWDEKTVDFMGGKSFDGNRWNDCHYTNQTKQAAKQEKKK